MIARLFLTNKFFRRVRSSGFVHSKKSLVASLKDQKRVVMKLTGTWIRESSCLSGEDEEEDGLECDAAGSPEGRSSCRQTYRFPLKWQSWMMMRVSEPSQLEHLEGFVN